MAKAANIVTVRSAAVAPSVCGQAWARVLSNASGLTELSLYGSTNLQNLRSAYTVQPNETVTDQELYIHAELSSQPTLLTQLRTLNVYGLDLSAPSMFKGDKHLLTSLLKVLPQPVDELCICYSNMYLVDRMDIAAFVNHGHIVWDGSETGLNDLPSDEHPVSEVETPFPTPPAPPQQHQQMALQGGNGFDWDLGFDLGADDAADDAADADADAFLDEEAALWDELDEYEDDMEGERRVLAPIQHEVRDVRGRERQRRPRRAVVEEDRAP
eukprot:GHVU01051257.1.p1 GENE.GHVU01051257.1~~GHVU01051257.1.p1  ORF type:complete len:303 (-),score=42.79 GHVU01051257.1:61-870(-)